MKLDMELTIDGDDYVGEDQLVSSRCAKCDIDLHQDAYYCNECGGQAERSSKNIKFYNCKNCDSQVIDSDKFCTGCGIKIAWVSE